jgi:hypothetical protein
VGYGNPCRIVLCVQGSAVPVAGGRILSCIRKVGKQKKTVDCVRCYKMYELKKDDPRIVLPLDKISRYPEL